MRRCFSSTSSGIFTTDKPQASHYHSNTHERMAVYLRQGRRISRRVVRIKALAKRCGPPRSLRMILSWVGLVKGSVELGIDSQTWLDRNELLFETDIKTRSQGARGERRYIPGRVIDTRAATLTDWSPDRLQPGAALPVFVPHLIVTFPHNLTQVNILSLQFQSLQLSKVEVEPMPPPS